MLRDVKLLCERLGFEPPARTLHAFRHIFAVNYLRRGESVLVFLRSSALAARRASRGNCTLDGFEKAALLRFCRSVRSETTTKRKECCFNGH